MSQNRNTPLPQFEEIYGLDPVSLGCYKKITPPAILVTGAQGMLGNGLATALDKLVKLGKLNSQQLIFASRNWSSESIKKWEKNPHCKLIHNEEIARISHKIDLVIHTASPSNVTQIKSFNDLEKTNVGMLKILQKLDPTRVVFISSGEVYGGKATNEQEILSKFTKTNLRDWYPLSKIAAETELIRFAQSYDREAYIIRLFHTFGPGVKIDDGRSFADILWGAAKNREIVLKSQGQQLRTFLYLSDAVNGILSVSLSAANRFKIVNLGSPKPISVLEFAQLTAQLTESTISIEPQSDFHHSPNKVIIPTIENLTSMGWNASVELSEGIQRTVAWIRKTPKS